MRCFQMLNIVLSNRFKKDLKTISTRNSELDLLDEVVNTRAAQKPLPAKNKDHPLTGDYVGFRECHVQPDWLLVYRVEDDDLILFLSRTGTHSDLF